MTDAIIVPVILCGGSGTRLWPLSRRRSPKQFLPLLAGRSLFDEAVRRGIDLCKRHGDGEPELLCVTVDAHKYLVQDSLDNLEIEAKILVEPVGRNTTPALCIAALQLKHQHQNATMIVLPSDHVIDHSEDWHEVIAKAVAAARSGRWVCLGIEPDNPSGDFGYIKQGQGHENLPGMFKADGFCEKPDAEKAQKLCDQGWLWNAGIAVVQTETVLQMIAEQEPEVYEACVAAMARSLQDEGFIFPDRAEYRKTPAVQIDKGVLENSDRVSLIPFSGDWHDIGTWTQVEQLAQLKDDGNRVDGDVLLQDCRQVYVRSPHRLIVALGLEDISIVDTPDALLVAGKDRLDGVALIVNRLVGDGRREADVHLRVARPWGHFDVKADEPGYKVKCVVVRPGAALSSQYHDHRAEHWIVVRGVATICCDGTEREISVNESVFIPQGTVHRLENRTEKPLELVEVQTGDYLGEDDIVRLEDVYGRV